MSWMSVFMWAMVAWASLSLMMARPGSPRPSMPSGGAFTFAVVLRMLIIIGLVRVAVYVS